MSIKLIDESLKSKSKGKAKAVTHSKWILTVLKETLAKIADTLQLVRIFNDFTFSCTVDIVNEKSSKEQNILGLVMARKLQQALYNRNYQEISEAVF